MRWYYFCVLKYLNTANVLSCVRVSIRHIFLNVGVLLLKRHVKKIVRQWNTYLHEIGIFPCFQNTVNLMRKYNLDSRVLNTDNANNLSQ